MASTIEDNCCVAGSASVPDGMLRKLVEPNNHNPTDATGKHLFRLMALHPQIVRFRLEDLASMDQLTKELLLSDMFNALEVEMPKNGNP